MKSLWVENEEVVTKAAEGLKGRGVAGSLADPDEAPHLKSEKVIAPGGVGQHSTKVSTLASNKLSMLLRLINSTA